MSIDLKHMVKVYNYVNDEKKHRFNYKFLALFAGLLVAGTALVAFAVQSAPGGTGGSDEAAAAKTQTDYVGLSPAEVTAGAATVATLQERLDSWYAAHPRADVKGIEPVYDDGRLVGYLITYARGG